MPPADPRTLVVRFRAHLINPGWSWLKFFNLIAPAKTLFPDRVTSTGIGGSGSGHIFLETTIQPTTIVSRIYGGKLSPFKDFKVLLRPILNIMLEKKGLKRMYRPNANQKNAF